jgi:hypothetical protein
MKIILGFHEEIINCGEGIVKVSILNGMGFVSLEKPCTIFRASFKIKAVEHLARGKESKASDLNDDKLGEING